MLRYFGNFIFGGLEWKDVDIELIAILTLSINIVLKRFEKKAVQKRQNQ